MNKKKNIISIIVLSLIVFNIKLLSIVKCPFKLLTGKYCPGCGITRMFLSIIKLDFYQAFRYNQLVFVLLPFFLIYFLDIYISKLKKKKSIMTKIPNCIFIIILIIIIVYGILRNINGFEYLRPKTI